MFLFVFVSCFSCVFLLNVALTLLPAPATKHPQDAKLWHSKWGLDPCGLSFENLCNLFWDLLTVRKAFPCILARWSLAQGPNQTSSQHSRGAGAGAGSATTGSQLLTALKASLNGSKSVSFLSTRSRRGFWGKVSYLPNCLYESNEGRNTSWPWS